MSKITNQFNNEDMDLKIMNFIKMIENRENAVIPEPSYFTISTQSAMCNMDNVKSMDLSKIVVHVAKNIIDNIVLKKNMNYLIRGIVIDSLIIRFDESYLKKYKNPYIKYMGEVIDYNNVEECIKMYNNIQILENNSLKKHGRQKKKKDNEFFYNSCSIIVKASLDIKCVNIKLFNNGKITLTGSKDESDGYYASCVLLDELKKEKDIFIDMEENEIKNLKIVNYRIIMINSDFNTNFKIDLIKLLNILNSKEGELFTKFNPEKYRGLIIGFYWNTDRSVQNGICTCNSKCNGKGCGTGDGNCKKITISIFKSGSVIITGGRLIKQVEDTYRAINDIFETYYHDIIKLSILDYMDDEDINVHEDEPIMEELNDIDSDTNTPILPTNEKETTIKSKTLKKKIKIIKEK